MAAGRPKLELVETTSDRITILADFPHLKPALLFDYWTNPDLLRKWWPPAAELQPELGGTYHFSWPKQDWHLRGKFTMFDRGKALGFTWKWDHESVDVTRVTLLFHSMPNGGGQASPVTTKGTRKARKRKGQGMNTWRVGSSFWESSKNKARNSPISFR